MKTPTEILVLDPGTSVPEVDTFNNMQDISALPMSYHLPALQGMATIESRQQKSKIAGIILLGSRASVDDALPWQAPLTQWLHERIEQEIPLFAICYGHQLLAHMFGGNVADLTGDKRKGLRQIRIYPDTRLGIDHSEEAYVVSHREAVADAPKGFEVWASSNDVPIDGLVHTTRPIWSMQAHVEATPLFCANNQVPYMHKTEHFIAGNSLLAKFTDYCQLFKQ